MNRYARLEPQKHIDRVKLNDKMYRTFLLNTVEGIFLPEHFLTFQGSSPGFNLVHQSLQPQKGYIPFLNLKHIE